MSSLSFPWKRIEERPENAGIVSLLIENAVDKGSSLSKDIKQTDLLLEKFISHFSLKELFSIDLTTKKTEKKSKKTSNKEQIIMTNELKTIDADFQNFCLNPDKSLKRVIFSFEINYYLYILWWGIQIINSLKKKEKVSPYIILDVTLSLNRLLMKDIIKNENYIQCFRVVEGKFNSIMNPTFYNLLFNNPKLLVECSLQMYNNEVKLYKEQRIILDKIKNAIDTNKPLLLGNQMPTGQGKTFLSVPLAKMLSQEKNKKRKKCVLFACSNELVNMDVASNALVRTDIHLWLAKNLIIDITDKSGKVLRKESRVLLRPYKSCFPTNWKTIYKKKEDDKFKNGTIHEQWTYYTKATEKIPDIIVADLDSCLEILKYQHSLVNQRINEKPLYPPHENTSPFIAYIDEFISDEVSNPKMAKICHFLPRQTVLLSSVLPKFDYIPSIVINFCSRHETTVSECLDRVSSTDVSIPCCIIHPDGHICFPHHQLREEKDVVDLIEQMNINPRIRRTYSSKHVFFWSKDIEDVLPDEIKFDTKFPSIGTINSKDIVQYVLDLLIFLKENFELLPRFQNYRPRAMNPVSKEDLFTKQSWEYEPKTLVVMNDPMKQVIELTNRLFKDKEKLSKILNETEKEKQIIQKKIDNLKKRKVSSNDKKDKKKIDKVDTTDNISELLEELHETNVKIPPHMVINHEKHFHQYNDKTVKNPKTVSLTPSMVLPNEYFSSFSDDEIYQLLAGIGVYDKNQQTENQRDLIMKIYHSFLFFCSGKEIVYGTNLSGLVNIFLDEEFVDTINTPELYQLMGRVGRMGRSYHANIITTHQKVVDKLLSFDDSFEEDNDIERLY